MKPAILVPAEAPNAYLAARLYAAMGLSVLPCTGKKPALSNWKHLQSRAATKETIDLWHKTGLLQNVGIICGAVSGNLAVIDLDGHDAVLALKMRFPDLFNTYAVTSGSGSGMHLYFFCDVLPPTTRVVGAAYGNIELRSSGSYVVAPPSIHPSGKPYSVAFADDITYLPHLHDVVYWIKRQIAAKHGGTLPPASTHKPRHTTAYGVVALGNATADVLRALPGERNNRLFRMALKMGSLIADGWIDRARVERELLAAAAALTQSDGEAATRRTIESGIETGMQHPRSAWEKRD